MCCNRDFQFEFSKKPSIISVVVEHSITNDKTFCFWKIRLQFLGDVHDYRIMLLLHSNHPSFKSIITSSYMVGSCFDTSNM